jgi:preprotein translocase subunit SecB
MPQPPLQLERSFITNLEVNADPEHKPGMTELEVQATRSFGPVAPDGSHWHAELDLRVGGKPGTHPPYSIRLHSVGLFSFGGAKLTDAEKAQLLAITGVSILYSQARECILMLTGRGPWGPYQLPTVSFVEDEPSAEAAAHPAVRETGSEYQAGQNRKRKTTQPKLTGKREPQKPRRRA